MNETTRRLGWGLGLATLALAGLAPAAGGDEPKKSQAGTTANAGPGDEGGTADKPMTVTVRKLSDFSPAKIRNENGQRLGRIESVVVDTRDRRVRYGVISCDKSLNVGEMAYALPWQAFKADIDDKDYSKISFLVHADPDRLKNAGGFDQKNWPNLADRRWTQTTYQFWNLHPYWQEERATVTDRTTPGRATIEGTPISPSIRPEGSTGSGMRDEPCLLVRGKDLIGHRVLDSSGKDFAELKEVMADPNCGHLVYAILQIDKSPDFDKGRLCPVPIESLEVRSPVADKDNGPANREAASPDKAGEMDKQECMFARDANAFSVVLNLPKDKLQSGPKFTELGWPMMTMTWGEQVYQHYGIEPFWKRSVAGREGMRAHDSTTGDNPDDSGVSPGTTNN